MAQSPRSPQPSRSSRPSPGAGKLLLESPVRNFSVADANKAIPYVRRVVTDLVSTHAQTVSLKTELDNAPNAQSQKVLAKTLDGALARLQQLHAELLTVGVHLTNPLTGEVDFPAVHNDQPVFLTWTPAQTAIESYHTLTAATPHAVSELQQS